MRTFLALNFSPEFKKKLYFFHRLPSEGVKWVEAENLHLTLFFAGETVNSVNLGAVCEALKIFKGVKKFRISLSSPGFFPDFERPKVIWAGLAEGAAEVEKLRLETEKALGPLGFVFERKFIPHLTLGRVKKTLPAKTGEFLKNYIFSEDFYGEIEEAALIESFLSEKGPEYKILGSWKFL